MALTINLTGVEPAFAKNTAFNKNFGTSSGDILLLGSTSVASKVLVTDSNNKVKTSSTTETQLSYLDATSSIQTQLDNKVPYTGATSDVNLGEFGIQLGNLEFDNTPTNVPTGAGSLVWNDTDGTLDLGLKGGLLNKIGQQVVVRARNNSGSAITKGSVVKVIGVAGGFIGINLALGDSDANSATAFGIVAEDIADASNGFVSIQGIVHGLNTNSFTEGDVLYLSPTVAGTFTNVKPVAPQHAVVVGYVAKKSATDGHILMHVQNGYELEELHNVLLTSSADKDILAYESSTSLWKNKSASTLGIVETSNTALTDTRIRKVSVQSNTDASTSATTAETVLKTLLVPTLGANTTLKIMAQCGKVGTGSNAVFKMYYNTTADLSGSPVQIALSNFIAASLFAPFNRDITNKNSVTSNSIFPATASAAKEILSSTARTNLDIDLSGKYIVITGKAGVVGDSVRVDNARLLIEE